MTLRLALWNETRPGEAGESQRRRAEAVTGVCVSPVQRRLGRDAKKNRSGARRTRPDDALPLRGHGCRTQRAPETMWPARGHRVAPMVISHGRQRVHAGTRPRPMGHRPRHGARERPQRAAPHAPRYPDPKPVHPRLTGDVHPQRVTPSEHDHPRYPVSPRSDAIRHPHRKRERAPRARDAIRKPDHHRHMFPRA